MNSILASHPIEERAGFLRRQLNATQTPGKAAFDVVFGVLMPLFCFCFDPGIIRGTFFTPLGELSIFIYGFSGLASITLSIWVFLEHRTPSLSGFFGGVLLAGATISVSIGVIILPLTLIGILFVIGLLGFVPFITGFVYLRNGLRAITPVSRAAHRTPRLATVVLSAVIAVALPGAAQWTVNDIMRRSIAEILDPNSTSLDASVARIKRLHLVVDTDRIVREYEKESSTARQEMLARAYKEITGEEIETRLRVLKD